MKKNKHLLLWSSLGTLLLLGAAAYQEHFQQEWRDQQQNYSRLLAPDRANQFKIQLRQIVIPSLNVTDRCVSCHIGMAPGETAIEGHAVFKAHPRVVHDPNEYGCTTCHAGQGRATTAESAHGTIEHWPMPMIPKPDSEAGCGACHTHLAVPDVNELRAGQSALERADCLACHALDGRGGTERPFAPTALGPDLSLVGARGYDTSWYQGHLEQRGKSDTGPWADSFGPIDETDLRHIEKFLASRFGAPKLIEAKSLFHSMGCRGCHPVHGVGGEDGPDLSLEGMKDPGQLDFSAVPGQRTLANWLRQHFKSPAVLVAGSQMPMMGLSEADTDKLTLYMLSLRRTAFPEAYWPLDRVRAVYLNEREFDLTGETLYGTFCSACHGARGEGMRYPGMAAFPAIANPDFLAVASNDFVTETVRRGRPGRRMPAWGEKEGGLRPEEIQQVVQYVRGLGATPEPTEERPTRWVDSDPAEGSAHYARNCAACHGAEGQGGEGPALNNRVLLETATDTYLVETVKRGRRGTNMPSFRQPSLLYRVLTDEQIESVVAFIRSWEKNQ